MFKKTKQSYYSAGACLSAGLLFGAADAHATGTGTGGNTFSNIGENIIGSVASLPGLITGLAYLFGVLLGVLGIMKIKDHVENPTNTPLKDGAIRLAAGGALFALPIVFEAMFETVGEGDNASAAQLNRVDFALTDSP